MKKKTAWLAALAPVLVVALIFGAYQAFRFPAAFRRLSNKALSEDEVHAVREEILSGEDQRILVAYFSYSGTTKGVAEALSGRLSADLFEISPKEAYSSLYLESNMEIRSGKRPELSGTVENMAEYDIVFVGYPNMEQGFSCVSCV